MVKAALGSMFLRPLIRRASGVVVAGSGGIHSDPMLQALLLHLAAKHAVRGGARADIAQAHEKNSKRFRFDHAVLILWLLRVRSMKKSGLVFTHATKFAMSG